MTATGYDRVLAAADDLGIVAVRNGSKFTARCPAHEDGRASLSVGRGDQDRALIHCFAGCATPDVVTALGLTMRDLFGEGRDRWDAAYYVYEDEEGNPLIRVIRTYPKGFHQERWDTDSKSWLPRLLDTRRVLYNLPAVVAADEVWLVEGEKDVETLRQEGVVATSIMGGANNWRDDYAGSLRGKRVHIIADNDKPGIEGAMRAKNGLRGIAEGLDVWVNPHGKDVTDLFTQGYGLGDLVRHVTEDGAQFDEMNWQEWEPEETEWLFEPYVPKNARVLAFGPAGSLKSLWAMWLGAKLAGEDHKVAYFSLEMTAHEVSKRLQRLDPPRENFRLFRKLSFESQADLAAACELLQGFSLIIVDSWSAVHGESNNNDAVAKLDREFFLPLLKETGATLLILDNTGQAVLTDRGKVLPDWARGASAKGDKMDMSLMFDRPDEDDNYTARIRVRKMRGDSKMPKPMLIRTGAGDIDFRIIDQHQQDLGPLWNPDDAPPPPKPEPKPETPMSVLDKLREARAKGQLEEEKA